jgi:anaerobic magnesium-protoporphyrin IX monomethyl ester cyclase
MRITFVMMGWENLSIQYISSYLKKEGHEVSLAYDQSLFDDKNYLSMPFLAQVFDQGNNIIKQTIDTQPDLICFSVMSVTHQWALNTAKEVKKHLDVPICFGGIHAIICPDEIIEKKQVDMVCLGEGEYALADLLTSLEKGAIDTTIKGFYFKLVDGEIIKNEKRGLIADMDEMPFPDKELFAPFIPIKNYYLAVTNRGCPFSCSYCSVSAQDAIEQELENFKKVRERSVDNVLEELRINKKKYNYKWIDFRNPVFSPSKDWILEFCEKYRKQIDLPFRIFSHPLLIREDTSVALKEAGCFAIQMGLESYDPNVRNKYLHRVETNEQINKAIKTMEKVGITYSLDYILNLPGQEEPELREVGKLFASLKHLYRVSPFLLTYLPKLKINEYAIEQGALDSSEEENINQGLQGSYMDIGSDMSNDRRRLMETYKLFFRLMSFIPRWMKKFFYITKLYHIFYYLPYNFILRFFDLSMVVRDYDANAYAKNYWWWFMKRFNLNHPNSYFNNMPSSSSLNSDSRTKLNNQQVLQTQTSED